MNPRASIFAISQWARIPIILLGFLMLSLFIHLVTFYLFRVEYPPSVTISPPPARVVMLQPDTPENRAFLQWIDASDPALLSQTPMAMPPTENIAAFEPSYATRTNEPITSEWFANRPPVTFPEAIDGITLSMLMEKTGKSVAPTTTRIPSTAIAYDTEIEQRLAGKPPLPVFEQTREISLMPATFLVGTPSLGEKPLVFLQTGSGDEALDLAAEGYLRQLPFARGKSAWGFVTFYWGPEVFAHTGTSGKSS